VKWNLVPAKKRDLREDLIALFNWFIDGLMKIYGEKPRGYLDP